MTSLAALRNRPELEHALQELQRQLEHYMATKARSFQAEVARKRTRSLGVTAFSGIPTRRRRE